jgi:hypothetical protein
VATEVRQVLMEQVQPAQAVVVVVSITVAAEVLVALVAQAAAVLAAVKLQPVMATQIPVQVAAAVAETRQELA